MEDAVRIRILASGSSGNSMFVQVGGTRLLIDAGISLRRIRRGLDGLGESVDALDAVVLTHEHSDHIKGLERLLREHTDVPVYASAGTREGCEESFGRSVETIEVCAGRACRVGGVELQPFELVHDANEPIGYRLETDTFAMGLATDLGFWTDEVADALDDCQVLVVEANHDADMLRRGPYPSFLKRRISGSEGHLSNRQANALVRRVAGPRLEYLVLGHLSGKNNDPDLAVDVVGDALGDLPTRVLAARRKEPTELLELAARPSARTSSKPSQGVLF